LTIRGKEGRKKKKRYAEGAVYGVRKRHNNNGRKAREKN